ncbi:TonB-dependent receptor [Roseivirga pacifica]|uniref:TonB-dependent receptor n=1 Tax=Roseivirga pacifica TaxID=1267423 RepID=UPI002096393C|nr:TonB-dependent receptor [Roseivirga pacifica]MCO6358941.1 TonB-dependent receptor plug domain-containing protein [Roseivirga pacifica]MCO6365423.1 TonB-dependent receptor plug domain-containing protein [Roseivirga pacifica]MCO6371847.1 TonB-dependent receptor plug domain-containing protein [Roseivirga pacifica]MCO6376042.1 TonB-dependent receptor plug domain-containing protein [Roseivirga pacifica]MCO6379225.1 TonB-dependent receptor plug domain-containing protein [Roseivirga pacifica]
MNKRLHTVLTVLLLSLCLIFSFSVRAQTEDTRVLIGDPNKTSTGRVLVKGKVLGKEERSGLFSATVAVKNTNIGVITTEDGSFEFTINTGSYTLIFQFLGKQSKTIPVQIVGNGSIEVTLEDEVTALQQVTIEAQGEDRNIAVINAGVNQLSIKEIESLPTFMGEVDVISSLKALPGVGSVGEGASGFNVRGGRTDQNLILQDGAILFNANHVLGFFSSFNPDATDNFTLYKGNMPANYGGRVSSVLDVNMKEGNTERVNVKGGLGLVASRLLAEGPINKGSTRFLVAARASYSDWVLKQSKNIDVVNSSARFHDVNLKLTQRINASNRLNLSYYKSGDYFKYTDEFGFRWNTDIFNLNWRSAISDRLVSSTRVVKGDYRSQLFDPSGVDAAEVNNGVDYWQANQTFYYNVSEKNNLTFGADYVRYDLKDETSTPLGDNSGIVPETVDKESGNEYALFINDEMEIGQRLGVSLGLRYAFFQNVGPYNVYQYAPTKPILVENITDTIAYGKGDKIKSYSGLEPRIGVRYKFNESTSVKLSFNRTQQFIHTLSNSAAATPTDELQLSNTYFKPLISNNYSIGLFKNYADNKYELSAEVYYRAMDNLLDYKDFVDLLLNDHLETDVLAGKGRAYGLELFLKKSKGVLTGWLAYTLGRTEVQMVGDEPDETINDGEWYPANFDRTHSFSFVSTVQLRGSSSFNWNIVYNTGRPINAIESNYRIDGTIIPDFSDRNAYRIPDYFRVDLSFTFGRDILKAELRDKLADRRYKGTLTIGIYNVLARKNAYSVFFKRPDDFGLLPRPHRLTVLGAAFPTLTYNFQF